MSYDFLIWKDSRLLTFFELQRLYTQLSDKEDVPLAPAPGLDACLTTLKRRVLPGKDKAAAIQWEASDIAANYAILRCAYSQSEALAAIVLNETIRANLACYDIQEDIALFPCDPHDAERALEGLETAEQGDEVGAVIFVADQEKSYYVQCASYHEDSTLRLEVAGPSYIAPEDQITEAQHQSLLTDGWNPPDEDGNYWRTHTKRDGLGAIQLCMKALRNVFRAEDDSGPIGLEFVSY